MAGPESSRPRPIRERLASVRKVFVHGSCPDGTGAAMIVAAAFREAGAPAWKGGAPPEFSFIQHGTREYRELVPEEGVLFVDIAPHEASWESWKKFRPIVLDHHATAAHVTAGLGGILGGPQESGATLAWMHVMCPVAPFRAKEWGDFAKLCAIRDNWVKGDKLFHDSGACAAALTLFGGQGLVEEVLAGTLDLPRLLSVGKMAYEQQMRKAKKVAEGARLYDEIAPGGAAYRVGFFNCTEKLASDACDVLMESGCEVACGYFLTRREAEDLAVFSVRTRRGGMVSARAVAEAHGGGGHQNSAAFSLGGASSSPMEDVILRVRETIMGAVEGG